MFYTKKNKISDFLVHGGHVLNYLENDPEAQALLAQYGIGPTQLQNGRMLFLQVQQRFRDMQALQRKRVSATDNFHQEWKLVRDSYQVHLQAARRVLGRDAQPLLRPLPAGYAGWLEHAQGFYNAVLGNVVYQQALATVKVSVEAMIEVNDLLTTLAANKAGQTQSMTTARKSTKQRNQDWEKSKRWFEVLMGTARVAFRDYPGILEALRAVPPRTPGEPPIDFPSAPNPPAQNQTVGATQ